MTRSEELTDLYERWYELCGKVLQSERKTADRKALQAAKKAVGDKIRLLEKSWGVEA